MRAYKIFSNSNYICLKSVYHRSLYNCCPNSLNRTLSCSAMSNCQKDVIETKLKVKTTFKDGPSLHDFISGTTDKRILDCEDRSAVIPPYIDHLDLNIFKRKGKPILFYLHIC